jgi:hypothetical protein
VAQHCGAPLAEGRHIKGEMYASNSRAQGDPSAGSGGGSTGSNDKAGQRAIEDNIPVELGDDSAATHSGIHKRGLAMMPESMMPLCVERFVGRHSLCA